MDFNVDETTINDLPDEALAHVFSFLSKNKLGQIARVCKRWNTATKYSTLWKKVEVKFDASHASQETVTNQLINWLPYPTVLAMHLDFIESSAWSHPMDFRNLGQLLCRKCPQLNLMLMQSAVFCNSLGCILNVCSAYLPQLKTLILRNPTFPGDEEELSNNNNIQVLEISALNVGDPIRSLNFNLMPSLKELFLYGSFDCFLWLSDETVLVEGGNVIGQLTVLHVGYLANGNILRAIKSHCPNLKELYLCNAGVRDNDLIFHPSTFPHLTTICLRGSFVTETGITSLLQSCPSLRNIFVEDELADFFVGRDSIVKGFKGCFHHLKFTS